MDLSKYQKPLLIVAPNELKDMILKENHQIINLNFITLEALIQKITFSYDDRAIYLIMKQYNVKYDVAITYLNNLRLITLIKNKTNNENISKLNEIYQLLNNAGYLKTTPLYFQYLKNKLILIMGYPKITKEDLMILQPYDYQIVTIENSKKDLTVTQCLNLEKELQSAFERICSLIMNKTPINDILLCGIKEEDIPLTSLMASFYNLPINVNSGNSLYDYPYIQTLIKNFFNDGLLVEPNINESNYQEKQELYNNLITILNKINIPLLPLDEIKKQIILKMVKNHKLNSDKYQNGIELIDFSLLPYYHNKHIFILGLNQNKLIPLIKDDGYFKDSIKKQFNFSTSYELNEQITNNAINGLFSDNELYLSYASYDQGTTLYPLTLIEDLNMKTMYFDNTSSSNFSASYNRYLLIKDLDNYRKYLIHHKNFIKRFITYNEPYLTYNNQFTGLTLKEYQMTLKNKLNLSYTSINTYYECAFKYYINKILYLDPIDETFMLFIGNLYHEILSKAFNSDFDFVIAWEEAIKNNSYTLKDGEDYLLIKLKEKLKEVITILKNQLDQINYQKMLFEKPIDYQFKYQEDDVSIIVDFKGIIDKVMYEKVVDDFGNSHHCGVVIDYKTGNVDFSLDYIEFGLLLQLPIYLFLMSKSKLLPDLVLKGFFLQKVLHDEPKMAAIETETDYQKRIKDNYLLEGYVIDDPLLPFDKNENNSTLIRGLKRRSDDGCFYATSKVIDHEKAKDIVEKVETKINEAVKNIINANFIINPKIVDGINLSCKYCTYYDLCYLNPKNYIYLKTVGDHNDQN